MRLHSSADIGPRTTIIYNPLRHNIMQNNLVRGPLKKAGTGPRTTVFHNVLSFNKIQKCRVRGPSHIGQSPAICDIWFSTTSPEICTPRMPMKAYIEGRPRISRHLHRDMLPDDATGNVYQGLPVHISRDPDSSLVAQNDRAPRPRMTGKRFCFRFFAGRSE